jgi:hypothetical protein
VVIPPLPNTLSLAWCSVKKITGTTLPLPFTGHVSFLPVRLSSFIVMLELHISFNLSSFGSWIGGRLVPHKALIYIRQHRVMWHTFMLREGFESAIPMFERSWNLLYQWCTPFHTYLVLAAQESKLADTSIQNRKLSDAATLQSFLPLIWSILTLQASKIYPYIAQQFCLRMSSSSSLPMNVSL